MPFKVPKNSRSAPFKSSKVLKPTFLSVSATFDEKTLLINSPKYDSKELLSENKHFNLEHLYKIALALDIDMNEFFKDVVTTK